MHSSIVNPSFNRAFMKDNVAFVGLYLCPVFLLRYSKIETALILLIEESFGLLVFGSFSILLKLVFSSGGFPVFGLSVFGFPGPCPVRCRTR